MTGTTDPNPTGPRPLAGKVAVVTGATRGAGRGIACALGEAGATVYCTGRSVTGRPATPGRSETIDQTAALVDARGGRGIAVRTDHTDPAQVEALFARVGDEHGGLDILVDDVWGGDSLTEWGTPPWQLDLERARTLLDRALWSHLVTARHGLPLLVARGAGLIVEVTDGEQPGYRGALIYDLIKNAMVRLAYGLAAELARAGHGAITALAVTPGFLRSEAMLDGFAVDEATWRDAIAQDRHFAFSESPLYVGRAVAALAADPQVAARAGRVWASWELARAYRFTDADGSRPDWGAHFDGDVEAIVARGGPADHDERFLVEARYYQIHLDPDRAEQSARLRAALIASGKPPLERGP